MSVYDKSLEQIQNSYQFTDLEMAKMDYTLKVFAYELSKLVFFFVFFAIIGKFSEFAVCLVALLPFRWISVLRRRQSARDGRESRCKQAGSHSPTFKNHLHFFHFFYFVFSFKGKRQNDIHSRPFPFPSDLFFQYFLYFHRSVCQVAATDDDTLRHVAWTNSASGHVEILFIFHSSRAIH